MLDVAEVLFAHTEESRAVKLCVAADIIVRVRVQHFATRVTPTLFSVVAAFDVDEARVPVLLLARDVIAALTDQDALAGRGERVGERAAASSRADDDDVVMIIARHDVLLKRLKAEVQMRVAIS